MQHAIAALAQFADPRRQGRTETTDPAAFEAVAFHGCLAGEEFEARHVLRLLMLRMVL